MPLCHERSLPTDGFKETQALAFCRPSDSPLMSSANWPSSYSQPTWGLASSQQRTWPGLPDKHASWPAKQPPIRTSRPASSRPISRMPGQMQLRVQLARPLSAVLEKCVVCQRKMKPTEPRVAQNVPRVGLFTGLRCIGCLPPHMLRQAGGWDMVEVEERLPAPTRTRAREMLYYHVDRHDCWRH